MSQLTERISQINDTLDWVTTQIERDSPVIEKGDLTQIRSNLESSLAILEGDVKLAGPTTATRSVSLRTSGEPITVPTQPRFSAQESMRPLPPYDYQNPRVFGVTPAPTPAPTARRRTARTRPTTARVTGALDSPRVSSAIKNMIHVGAGLPQARTLTQILADLNHNVPYNISNLPSTAAMEYFVVLNNVPGFKTWGAAIVKHPDDQSGRRRVYRFWGSDRRSSLQSDHVDLSRFEAKEDVRKKLVMKTNPTAAGDRGKYIMVKGSKSVDNVGFTSRTKNQRNRSWRAATGINDGLFLYRSPERPERNFCPIEIKIK